MEYAELEDVNLTKVAKRWHILDPKVCRKLAARSCSPAICCRVLREAFAALQFAASNRGKVLQPCNWLPLISGGSCSLTIACRKSREGFDKILFFAAIVGKLSAEYYFTAFLSKSDSTTLRL
jgi:hypothetical protein